MNRKIKDYIAIGLKGAAMGAADVVPGVSGGTIAFISGIYEELINTINSVNLSALQLLLKGKFKQLWQAINGNFLISLVLGIGISFVSLARLIKYVLENHPVLLWSFFFGLVIASAITIAAKVTRWDAKVVIGIIIGTIAAYFITEMTPAETPTSYWFLFLSGALAICAMILPGISGSFILLILGKYEYVINAVTSLKLDVLLVVMSGAVVGLLSFSKLLSWLLNKYHNLAIAILSGFMIGSLNKIWPWKQVVETFTDRHGKIKPLIEDNILPNTFQEVTGNDSQLLWAVLLAITGFVLIYWLEKASNGTEKV